MNPLTIERDVDVEVYSLDTSVDGYAETLLIALLRGRFVGSVHLVYRDRTVAALKQLFVLKEERRKRIGTQLVNECLDLARAGGCESISLMVAAANVGLVEDFYRAFGFFPAAEYPDGDLALAMSLKRALRGGGNP